MYWKCLARCACIVSAWCLSSNFAAIAADIDTTASIGLKYTDNAALVSSNKDDDLILVLGAGAIVDASSGPYLFNVNTSLKNLDYTQDAFGDQTYFTLNAVAGWEMLRDRVNWKAQDFFSQQSINSLNPATPDNVQDTNVFTFGPNVTFPISSTQSITLVPEYKRFSYEAQNIDNQQESISASWNYKLFRTMSIGLSGSINETDYDDQAISDNTFTSLFFVVSGIRPRSNYSINLGATHVDRDTNSQRGVTGNINWQLNLTANTNIRTYIASELTDTNNSLLDASVNSDAPDVANIQSSSEVLRNSVVKLTYTRNDATLRSNIWAELQEQDYELTILDREVRSLGVDIKYPVSGSISTGVYLNYNDTELTDINRDDKQYSVGGNVNYLFSRRLSSVVDMKYQDKDSTLDSQDYSELSVFVNLVYGYGLR